MLTLEETGWSLNAFKIFSILNILPIGVDVENGKIERQPNGVIVFMWKILVGVGVSHWFYMFGRLVQSTNLEPEQYFRWDHFVLHFGMTLGYVVFYFTGFCLFVKTPGENVMIFNQLFEQWEDPVQKMINQEEEEEEEEEAKLQMQAESDFGKENQVGPRPLLTWPPQYSLDELMAKLVALIIVFSGFFAILILAIDPTRPQLLYSALPPEWQNVSSFLTLLAVEALCLGIACFNASFAIFTQVMFFGKVQLELQRMSLQLRNLKEKFQNRSLGVGHIEKEIWILRQILEAIRKLVLLIELFNRCFPFCIFAWKIFALSICINFYFFLIRHFQGFPFLAVFMGYVATAITVIYTVMYAHAFSIPGKMDDLKKEFLLTAQNTTSNANANFNLNKNLRAEMKREIKRIHGVGIKVGSFHQMERESSPNFVDFVLRQVVSLLVTFPR